MKSIRHFCTACLLLFGVTALYAQRDGYSGKGQVQWPIDYVLEIPRPEVRLPDQKQYLANVVQNLILDELSLQRHAVTRGNVEPLAIEYPLRKDHENLPENEREALLAQFPRPGILPLKVVRQREVKSAASCASARADRYTLLSHISPEAGRLKIDVMLCQGSTVHLKQASATDEQEMVTAVNRLMNPVRARLTGDAYASLNIETTPAQASVYLDSQFLGKTPLRYSYLIPGNYQLVIKKDGFETTQEKIATKAGENAERKITLAAARSIGVLDIKTEPEGAKIYLDADFKGLTPKKIEGLALGTYRLHLLSPEKGEVYKTVNLTENQPQLAVSEKLSSFFDKSPTGFLGISYRSWYFVSLTASAVSMGTAIGFFVWRDQAKEQEFGRLSGKSTSLYTQEDYDFLAARNSEYKTRDAFGTGFMIGAGFFAVAAIYFYVQHLLSADEGIVMKQPKPDDSAVDIRLGGVTGATGITASFRF